MRAAILITLVLAWFLTSTTSIAQPAAPAPQIVTVMLRNFAFGPDHLRLLAGSPIQLRLTNQGSGSHNFSAPGFFAASRFPLGVTSPAGGMVEVGVQQTVELLLTPVVPGTYRLACTHFLHSLFGMTGTIEVVP